MDTPSVENTFGIHAFNTRTLTVDQGSAEHSPTFTGSEMLSAINGSLIWDKEAFVISWNADDSEVTFTFKEGLQLPTDRDTDSLPDYQIAFSQGDKTIKAQSGVGRDREHFRLVEGPFEASSKFAIIPDTKKPEVSSLIAQTGENPALKVIYSEPMIIYTKSRNVAGGMADRAGVPGSEAKAPAEYPDHQGNASGRNVAANYTVTITPGAGSFSVAQNGTWKSLGGQALYDLNDPLHKTILLQPPQNQIADIPAFVPFGQQAQMATASGSITMDGTDNSTWNFGWKLVKTDGSLSEAFLTGDLETAQTGTASSLAQLLQDKLNSAQFSTGLGMPTSANPWAVTFNNESLSLRFQDTTGTYVGWQGSGGIYQAGGGDFLPSTFTGTFTFAKGKFMKLFQSGDTVQVVAATTILDPASNPVESSRNQAASIVP